MSDETNRAYERDDEVAPLLGRATPRERPRAEAEAAAFANLHAEWHGVVGRRRRRNAGMLAAAAALFIAIGVVVGLRFGESIPPAGVTVATVQRVEGDRIASTGGGTAAARAAAGDVLRVGERLATGPGARLALGWHAGGSLRVDENTRLALESADAVELLAGSLYFDSAERSASGAALSIRTPAGSVRHVGTQFMLNVRGQELRLRVREGQVQVTGDGFELTVDSGEEVDIAPAGVLEQRTVTAYDAAWGWAASIAPQRAMDGASALDILAWAARETGREVTYDSPNTEAATAATIVRGVDRRSPTEMLALLPLLTDLAVEVRDSVIVVSVR